MRSRQAQAVALVLLSALLLGAALTFILHLPDPLAQYRMADGGLRFFPAPKTYTAWESVRSPYPTLAILGTIRDLPTAERSVNAFSEQRARPLVLPNIDLLAPLRALIGLFTSDAAASCVGGNCFWIGGTGNFSNNAHWSLTSGGVTCVCTPGATDTVTFDGNSGSGTATVDIDPVIGSVAMSGSVALSAGSHTITVNGNWSTASFASFSIGTSTVILAASGTLTAGNFGTAIGDGPKDFYNLTISTGVTTTVDRNPTNVLISNVFTVNGTYIANILTGVEPLQITSVAGGTTQFPLVLGVSADLSRAGLLALINLNPVDHVAQYVPSATYMYLAVEGVAGTELRLLGDVSTAACNTTVPCSMLARTYYDDTIQSPTSFNFYTDNHALNLGGTFYVGDGNRVGGVVWLGFSTTVTHGIAPNGEGILHAQSATMTIQIMDAYTPSAIVMSSDGGTSYFYAETSTITVNGGVRQFNAADVFDLGAASISVGGNWDTLLGSTVRGTSMVTLTASGTLAVNDNGDFGNRVFYNLIINSSVTTTFTTPDSVSNVLTLGASAALVSSGGNPQRIFQVYGDANTTPLILGAGADMSQSGYFIYTFGQTTGHVTGGTYQHLAIRGPSGGTGDLLGDISTPLCGVFNECAIILIAYQPNTLFTFNTNNHNIRAGGTLWLGDGGGFGVTFNAGSSALTGYSITPTGNNTIAHFQTATITGRPSSVDTNICYESTYTVQVFFEQSTFNCYGQLRVSSGFIDAGSATINVIHQGSCMPSADCGTDNAGSRSPGEVVIFSGTYIIMGSSTWRVDSIWQNGNTVAEPNWSAGTGTVTFHQTGINTDFNSGGDVIGKAEFHNMVFDFDVTKSDTMVADNLWADGSVTLRNTHGASTTLDANTFTLRFGSLSVASSGATLGKDGFSLTNLSMSADTGTILLSAWTALDLTTPDVEWTFNPSTSSATVTVTKGGLPPNTNISLYRDGVSVDDGTSNGSGSITLSRTAGWSSHAMKIAPGPGPASGGGGGGTPPGDAILVTQVSGLTYKFSVQSNIGTVTSVSWDFGDGKTSSGLVVYHTFAQDGTYTITAQVTKAGGSTEPLTKTITVASAIPLLTMVLTFAVILMILAAFFVKGERRKFWLVAGAAAILAFDLTSYAKSFGSFDVVTALNAGLLLLAGIVSVVVGLLPTKEHRIRGKWLILGAVILISWWYLVLGGVL